MGSWSKYQVFILLWLFTALYIAFLPTRHYTQDAVNNLTYLEDYTVFEATGQDEEINNLLKELDKYGSFQQKSGAAGRRCSGGRAADR